MSWGVGGVVGVLGVSWGIGGLGRKVEASLSLPSLRITMEAVRIKPEMSGSVLNFYRLKRARLRALKGFL